MSEWLFAWLLRNITDWIRLWPPNWNKVNVNKRYPTCFAIWETGYHHMCHLEANWSFQMEDFNYAWVPLSLITVRYPDPFRITCIFTPRFQFFKTLTHALRFLHFGRIWVIVWQSSKQQKNAEVSTKRKLHYWTGDAELFLVASQ